MSRRRFGNGDLYTVAFLFTVFAVIASVIIGYAGEISAVGDLIGPLP